ncbi:MULTISPECIES: hypothetical protein [Pseudanabaena]|jgi:hypothetical protein|uniref:hypothetical protein n=1 Tax=Pseudanabaena TaxID=1152 RepID=UPI0024792410|nr:MULTISPECIES: hypothetical protein [Pseudanabaena]MEA5488894.1 hypothetical protein [Pseudanabaena sp. CCNP1317]WGS72381.1 hypothetical protein OA858_22145 [Pseudanabaena galeata CCNP1313]
MTQIFNFHILPRLVLVVVMLFTLLTAPYQAIAAERRPVIPANGQPILSGNMHGSDWIAASQDSKQAYCEEAFAAFRGSAAQSYIISHNIQSLSPEGLCDRMDQYYSLEEYADDRLGSAAAIAPILFADTPLGTKY